MSRRERILRLVAVGGLLTTWISFQSKWAAALYVLFAAALLTRDWLRPGRKYHLWLISANLVIAIWINFGFHSRWFPVVVGLFCIVFYARDSLHMRPNAISG
jgi:hypothetical protein